MWLDRGLIDEIGEAALALGLATSRGALFAGIDERIRSGVASAPTPIGR